MTVSVEIGGLRFEGWQQVEIRSSIEEAASSFRMTVTERYPGAVRPTAFKPGLACVVRDDEDVMITGFVDDVEIVNTATEHTITIEGRSKTGDLVDCSVTTERKSWANLTIKPLVDKLIEPYDLEVEIDVEFAGVSFDLRDGLELETETSNALGAALEEPIPRYSVNTGERIFDAVSRLAAMRALLVTDNPAGNLVLARAAPTAEGGSSIRLGDNLLESRARFSSSELYSEIRIKGQRFGTELVEGAAASAASGIARDPSVERTRILVVAAQGYAPPSRCRDLARWEAASRLGRSIEVSAKVQGWRTQQGGLWKKNTLCRFTDERVGIDADLLVVAVTYKLGLTEGTICEIDLQPKEAFELLPDAVRQAARQKVAPGWATSGPGFREMVISGVVPGDVIRFDD